MIDEPCGWILFLDDERDPSWDLPNPNIARDCADAIALVKELGVPALISFDHDLGVDHVGQVKPTAMSFLHWLIEQHLDGKLDLTKVKRIIVHSQNYQGAMNIMWLWNGFAEQIGSEVRAERRPRQSITK